jgi:hypothetical protein
MAHFKLSEYKNTFLRPRNVSELHRLGMKNHVYTTLKPQKYKYVNRKSAHGTKMLIN